MTNLEFFKACMNNELKATMDVIKALPAQKMDYKPANNSRTAYEIAEHIVAHAFDFEIILTQSKCDELLTLPFDNPAEASEKLEQYWNKAITILNGLSEDDWNNEMVELLIEGKSFASMTRSSLMWFYFFDIIHHRGQLTTYIRPMGGKNPAVYGYSFDTMNDQS